MNDPAIELFAAVVCLMLNASNKKQMDQLELAVSLTMRMMGSILRMSGKTQKESCSLSFYE